MWALSVYSYGWPHFGGVQSSGPNEKRYIWQKICGGIIYIPPRTVLLLFVLFCFWFFVVFFGLLFVVCCCFCGILCGFLIAVSCKFLIHITVINLFYRSLYSLFYNLLICYCFIYLFIQNVYLIPLSNTQKTMKCSRRGTDTHPFIHPPSYCRHSHGAMGRRIDPSW